MAELIWDGKYDEHGNKRAPVRIELPFQTVETVNESAQDRQRTLELSASGNDPEWRNRLIWGDKKYVLPSLLPEFAGKVDLIYIDPPFFTGTDQQIVIRVSEDQFLEKQPSLYEEAAYRNVWRQGLDSFFRWTYETLFALRELLTPRGAIFIRFDQYWSHYVKVIADDVFGKSNFQNEIIVNRIHKNLTQQGRVSIPIATDSLFLYFAGPDSQFVDIKKKLDEAREGYWRRIDDSSGVRRPPERKVLGKVFHPPPGKHFKFSQEKMDVMVKAGKIRINEKSGRPEYWVEPTDEVVVDSDWTDIPGYAFSTGYPTENAEPLLERSIKACSGSDALILDCFCGSGTTAAVAEKLNRRWIACDLGRFAIHTTRKRLLGIPGVKPFVVQNLGKYERQQWQVAEFAASSALSSRAEPRDPMPAGAQQGPREEFSARSSVGGASGENALRGRSSLQAGKGSFDSRNRFASESVSSAQDDRVRGGAQDDRALREQREREGNYRKFILELYHATPVSGYIWLHGVKGGRMVHVAAVDAPVTRADVNAIAAEVWKAAGKGPNSPQKPAVDVLGWEFALEINETAKEIAAQARVDAAFKKIPREVLEKKAVEQGDVHFFELGALSVDSKIKKRELTLKLSDFVIPLD
ncbi:MAG TPA: site-specific DNA-methyltransferase, partial [Terriglobales bacterium]